MKLNIRNLRVQKGLKQKELADYLGIKQNTLSQYEIGIRKPNIYVLAEIAQLFDCSIEDLIKED